MSGQDECVEEKQGMIEGHYFFFFFLLNLFSDHRHFQTHPKVEKGYWVAQ